MAGEVSVLGRPTRRIDTCDRSGPHTSSWCIPALARSRERDDPLSHLGSLGNRLIGLPGSWIGRPWWCLSDMPLAELPNRVGVDVVPRD